MGKLFDNPVMLIVLLIIILLLFGAPKLPGMARSLGQSMRIFKSEVDGMKEDNKKKAAKNSTDIVSGEVVENNGSHAATPTDNPETK
ncbi:Sec-independent protein translocase subunit TatA [Rothia aerolata]|uniref:Sec-independent protein translocase protein TatA n=1 Tax=Rothia aerolata TaxID=1812262 RepID=A0A917IN17_9MICC|nr:Sec-independent protein translocase subunit TatA [Rothia aerolata]GGH57480.1 Sec-independent protein translocase protein TatA [Rothia aerolata]